MYYITIGLLLTSYFYIGNKYLDSKYSSIIYFPAFYIYWFILGFQYDIGTDYDSYIEIAKIGSYAYSENNNEWLFVLLLDILKLLSLPPQSLFMVVGIIQTFLAFFLFHKLSKYNMKVWLIFFLFITVSTIYHNQMNGIRQFISLLSVPILYIFILEKKYIKSFIISLFALGFHNSFLIILALLPVFLWFKNITKKTSFLFFILSPIVIIFTFDIIFTFVIEYLFSNYSIYLEKDTKLTYVGILTKAYYIPLFFYFWYLYLNNKNSTFTNNDLFKFFILVFSITYCFLIMGLYFSLGARIFQYFILFYIFPIYYIIDYLIKENSQFALIVVFIYVLFPYIVKTVFLPVREYSFQTILF